MVSRLLFQKYCVTNVKKHVNFGYPVGNKHSKPQPNDLVGRVLGLEPLLQPPEVLPPRHQLEHQQNIVTHYF